MRADCQRAAMGKSNLCRLHGTQQQQQKLDAETTTTKPGILDPVTAEPIVAEKKTFEQPLVPSEQATSVIKTPMVPPQAAAAAAAAAAATAAAEPASPV